MILSSALVIWFLVCRFEARFQVVVREPTAEGTVRRSKLTTEARLAVVSRSRSHLQEAEAVADVYTAGSSERCRKTWLSHGSGVSVRGAGKGRCG